MYLAQYVRIILKLYHFQSLIIVRTYGKRSFSFFKSVIQS